MSIMLVILPATLFLAGLLVWFLHWTLSSGQYEDLEGAAARILYDD
ncbi:MAG: cbb3-type cytochrome oxidase assembly protein CcoS [Candidatus Sericytochromatia bacterium]|nr:cbb3-type cytochrome oxidase assembly protein CcoS [Candidatus Tanganyikabacteria bacterium]